MPRQLASFLGICVFALAACSRPETNARAATAPGIATLQVAAPVSGDARAWDGVIEAVQEARLSAQTAGRVLAVDKDVNDTVAAGEVLVRLSEVEQRAGERGATASLRAAEAALREAETAYRRLRELAGRQFVAASQLDQAEAARDAARAERDASRARLDDARQQAAYSTVRAPFPGVVGARRVEPGESVAPGQWLMTVFAPGALRIAVDVPQAEAALIRSGPQARVRLEDGRELDTARVTVFRRANPATHTVEVRVELPALDPPPAPGDTARVMFAATRGAAFARVPIASLVRRGEIEAVYVLADGRLSLRQLRLGTRIADEVEVISGLRPGEAIAADPLAASLALARIRGSER